MDLSLVGHVEWVEPSSHVEWVEPSSARLGPPNLNAQKKGECGMNRNEWKNI